MSISCSCCYFVIIIIIMLTIFVVLDDDDDVIVLVVAVWMLLTHSFTHSLARSMMNDAIKKSCITFCFVLLFFCYLLFLLLLLLLLFFFFLMVLYYTFLKAQIFRIVYNIIQCSCALLFCVTSCFFVRVRSLTLSLTSQSNATSAKQQEHINNSNTSNVCNIYSRSLQVQTI